MEAQALALSRLDGRWKSVIARFGDPAIAEAQHLQRRIYEAAGFVPDGQIITDDGLLLDEWSSSSWHLALFHDDQAVAHLRLIDPTGGPLPSQGWWPSLQLSTDCWEVSALAVDRGAARPFEVARRLYREAFQFAATLPCDSWVCAVEASLCRILSRWFPMAQIGAERELFGGSNVAMHLSFVDAFAGLSDGSVDQTFWPPTDADGNYVWGTGDLATESELVVAGVGGRA